MEQEEEEHRRHREGWRRPQLQAMWSEAAGDHQWLALTTPHAAVTKLGKPDASTEVRSAVIAGVLLGTYTHTS